MFSLFDIKWMTAYYIILFSLTHFSSYKFLKILKNCNDNISSTDLPLSSLLLDLHGLYLHVKIPTETHFPCH